MTKILFVPISIVGCGKSTVFRTLCLLYPNFAHIENDNFDFKPAFYNAIQTALNDASVDVVLLDRNNHLPMHRKEIITRFKKPNVRVVALLFVPKGSLAQNMRGHVLGRIALRGDNHQQIKGESDFAKTKMIVNSFVKSFTPYDANDPIDSQFDHVIQMDGNRESSEENVRRIVRYCSSLKPGQNPDFPQVSNERIKNALRKSLAFQVDRND